MDELWEIIGKLMEKYNISVADQQLVWGAMLAVEDEEPKEIPGLRKCSQCGEYKSLDHYIKRSAKCRTCRSAQKLEWAKKNPESRLASVRKYNNSPRGKACRAKAEEKRKDQGRYKAMNSASVAVCEAIKRGELIRPSHCECCGRECFTVAHHESYRPEDRLKVQWLCRSCHTQIHSKTKELN